MRTFFSFYCVAAVFASLCYLSLFYPTAEATCDLTGYSSEYLPLPDTICPMQMPARGQYPGCSCQSDLGDFYTPPPANMTWASFYNYIVPTIGVNGSAYEDLVDTKTTDPNIYIVADDNATCYIDVIFVGSISSYRSVVGWYLFDNATYIEPKSFSTIFDDTGMQCINLMDRSLAPNATYDEGQEYRMCTVPGSTVRLGPFSNGTNVGWWLSANGACECGAQSDYPIQTLYSLDSYNQGYIANWFSEQDKKTFYETATGRFMATFRDPVSGRITLSWDDHPAYQDQDYNDVIFQIESNCSFSTIDIPCNTHATCTEDNYSVNATSCTCECLLTCRGNFRRESVGCACYCPAECADPYVVDTATCTCVCPDGASCGDGDGLSGGETAGIAIGAIVGAALGAAAAAALIAALAALLWKLLKKGQDVPEIEDAINMDTEATDGTTSSPLYDNPNKAYHNPLSGSIKGSFINFKNKMTGMF